MKTQNPINAKSTASLLRILPQEFKMINDQNSNGFKFTNMVFGIEFDEMKDRLKSLYDELFLDTMDLSNEGNIYSTTLSGSPSFSGYLDGNGIKVKITSEDEFYNGDPTRLVNITGMILSFQDKVLGLNYFREDPRGSGYILANYDRQLASGYIYNQVTSEKFSINPLGALVSSTGLFTGIQTQAYDINGLDEVLTPHDSFTLSGRYPMFRQIQISGVIHNIEHYEPYKGWTWDQYGNIVAINDYFQDYYYDADGNKVFHRTYLNNPFGAGNYTKQYFNLNHIPISGTLRVFDMDILDISGNATEIPSSGLGLYYLAYSGMTDGQDGGNEITYKGYSQIVPNDDRFSYIGGMTGVLLATTSWDYQRNGSQLDNMSGVWIEPSSGNITNMISITNPQSRYIVEYKWQNANKAKYLTSYDATRYLSLATENPIYTLENLNDNVVPVDYKFTKNPDYVLDIDGQKVDTRSQIVTFDGWKIRPNSKIYKLNFNIPVALISNEQLQFFNIPFTHDYIGYSPEFVPQVNTIKQYIINCPFDEPVTNYSAIEDDLTGNSNFCRYTPTGTNKLFRIPMGSWYGKKIIYVNGESYYNVELTIESFIKSNTFFKFDFRPLYAQTITLMDCSDTIVNKQILIYITPDGYINARMGRYNYCSRKPMTMNNTDKCVVVRYSPDELDSDSPNIEVFMKDASPYLELIETFRQDITIEAVRSHYLQIFRNCSVDIKKFQIYYEAF